MLANYTATYLLIANRSNRKIWKNYMLRIDLSG